MQQSIEINSDPQTTSLQLDVMCLTRLLDIERAKMYIRIVDVVIMKVGPLGFQPLDMINELAEELVDCECDKLISLFNKYNSSQDYT